jgi:competence protein ComEA
VSALARPLLAAAVLVAAAPALAGGKALSPGERIDLGRAPVVELMRLPGIGEKKARAIVALRQRQPFRRVEDVLAVKGLGPAWLEKVKAKVTAGVTQGAPQVAPVAAHK